MNTSSLQTHLHRFGRRLLAIGIATGIGWGLAAALVLLLNGVWLDLLWEMPPKVRVACSVGALVAAVLLMVGAGWLALRRREPHYLASRLDQVAHTGGRIRSGVDLALEQGPMPPLTAGLAGMAVDQAAQLAGGISAARAIPARPVCWSFGSLGLLCAGVGLAVLFMPRLAWTQWLRFSDPFGDHPPFSRVIYHVEPGDIQVVYGAGLDIKVATEGALVERVNLVLRTKDVAGEEALPMFPEPGGKWTATVANVTAPGHYYVRSHAGRSGKFQIHVLTVPRLESVRFRISPPAYTNLADYEGPLPQGGLAGLPGTRVQVFAKSNRPLSGGSMEVSGPDGATPGDMTPVSPGGDEVTGTFEIRKPGKLQLKVIDVDGQASTDVFSAAIALLVDERPFIRLIEPRPLSFATPNVALPVVLAAEDDYGISRIQLFRSLNDSRALPMEVPVPRPAKTRWQEPILLPLSGYGLVPGDEIKLFGRVEDNDPAGPKGAESTVAVVRIISQEDFDQMARQREGMEVLLSKYRQAQRRLEALDEEVEKLQKKMKEMTGDGETEQERKNELKRLSRRLRDEAEKIRKSAQKDLPYDIDKHMSKELKKLAKQLEDAARDVEMAGSGARLSKEQAAKALEKLREKLAGDKRELDREAVEPLEHLAAIMPLLEDASRFVILYQQQRSLAERLQSLKGKDKLDDPALKSRMRDLQTEQQQLRTALSQLLDDIEDHVTKLPEDAKLNGLRESATDFVRKVRESGAAEAMTGAEAGLSEFSGTKGHDRAKEAADILEKFIARCQGGDGIPGQCMECLRFKPGLCDGLGDTVGQLLSDMGLMPGSKPGQGLGNAGGYSVRRNSLNNVGLYGGQPRVEQAGNSGQARDRRVGGPGNPRKGGPDGDQPSTIEAAARRSAAGAADTAVPTPYRRRVAEYFQRIADETGGK